MNKPWVKGDPNGYKLLTPGPLTTSLGVREAMLVDRCTWDDDYKAMTQEIRASLLEIAHADPKDYAAVLMQGSGTFGVESVLSSIPSKDDTVLVLVNGAYSERMIAIMEREGVAHERLDFAWDEIPDAGKLGEYFDVHPEVTYVSMVHSETTSGILNDIESVGREVRKRSLKLVVDAMSSFGAVDIDVPEIGIDFLISSANKCIQGVRASRSSSPAARCLRPPRATPARSRSTSTTSTKPWSATAASGASPPRPTWSRPSAPRSTA